MPINDAFEADLAIAALDMTTVAEPVTLGDLPEWDLRDLYPAMDSPELKSDLARAEAESLAFEKRYKGTLADLAKSGSAGRDLAEAVRAYEQLD